MQHLKEKVEAGADFIVTQLVYDPAVFLEFQKVRLLTLQLSPRRKIKCFLHLHFLLPLLVVT